MKTVSRLSFLVSVLTFMVSINLSADSDIRKVGPPSTTRPPKSYSRNQLLQIAINQNFQSRIERARWRQARLEARVAALNLIPRISLNTITRIVVPTNTSITRSVGDLLPFLLPTRWFQVTQRRALSVAAFDGWLLSKADAAYSVEEMFYATLGQVHAIGRLQKEYTYINSIYRRVKTLEQSQIKQIGSSDDILKILQSIELSISQLQVIVLTNMQALSQMSGFDSAQAVQGIVETAEVNLNPDQISVPDRQAAESTAISRSLELEQMSYWRKAINEDKKARGFMWLDPQGDSEGGLGAAFTTYLRVDNAKDEEVEAQMQLERAQLAERVDQALVNMIAARDEYHQIIARQNTENRRVARYTNNMDLGINFEMASLVDALQGSVSAELSRIQTSSDALLSQARLDRLQLVGPYQGIHDVENLWPLFQKGLDAKNKKGTSNHP